MPNGCFLNGVFLGDRKGASACILMGADANRACMADIFVVIARALRIGAS
ncbi:hypothetical protein TUM20286_20880 [Pseudomonas tohonis]|uniref:Uncharacterized protein n=1 Tax=Pseudomonas tohonis TaxID=2725477 RepID=A0ABQ4VXH6_9PSED|nr:hypothetical protein TUM20286_20880 [Pseudomonas tohonis]